MIFEESNSAALLVQQQGQGKSPETYTIEKHLDNFIGGQLDDSRHIVDDTENLTSIDDKFAWFKLIDGIEQLTVELFYQGSAGDAVICQVFGWSSINVP